MGEIAPGREFAGHRIEAVAGRGGMGVVYRARQLSLDRTVALKVIAPALTEDPAIRRRFLRESRIAASIDHPHVIPVYYTGEEGGLAFIAMRFVAGDDIRTLVRRDGSLGPDRAVRIVSQVADALDAAHAAGLVHRDVKPANVLLGPREHAYLTDFGLTRHALSEPGAGLTREGDWVGTLDFASPEQIRGERVDARSDVYSLGCVLFYMLAGHPPFQRETDEAKLWAHLHEPPPALRAAVPAAPPALDGVIARALAKAPEERYPSAGDLGRAAEAAASGSRPAGTERVVAVGAAAPVEMATRTAGTRLATADTSPARRSLGTSAKVGAGLGVALVAALVVGLLARSGESPKPGAAGTRPPAAPITPRVQSTFVGGRVRAVAGAGGHVWSGSSGNPRLTAIDAAKVRRLEDITADVGLGLQGLAAYRDTVWAIASRERRLVHFDGRSGRQIGKPVPIPGPANAVAADASRVWVATTIQGRPGDALLRFDARTGRLEQKLVVVDMVRRLVLADGALWLLATHPARVVRLDLRTGKRAQAALDADASGDLAAGAGAIWATLPGAGQVTRVGFKNLRNPAPIAVGTAPAGVAVSGKDVWVANGASSTVTRIDARTLRPREEIPVPIDPYEMIAYQGAIWVTSLVRGSVTRIDASAP